MVQLTQPKGMVSKETNKEAIARVFGLKKRQVGYLSTSTAVDSYVILFEESTQTCWYKGSATGTPVSWSISGEVLTLVTTSGTFTLSKAGYNTTKGSSFIGWQRSNLSDTVETVAQALDSRVASIWEYASYITDRPSNDPSTWDWYPAFVAAHADNVTVELIDKETYTIKSPLVYRYTSGAFNRSVRLPFCKGQAQLNYTTLGNSGIDFDDTKLVNDSSQPPYETAITVYGASGSVVLKQLEGIMFNGNKNTAAIKLIGCCGLKPKNNTYNSNRYGIVYNNGTSSGTFTELCVAEFSRWNASCLVPMAYERGGGDTSFHGCGMGQGCYASASSGSIQPTILIGAGCQPYHAPLDANIWRSGGANGVVILNQSGLNAHFHGNLKIEHSYGQIIASGSTVNYYGAISLWSGYDKGTLFQRLSGGPTGPSAGNLSYSGITTPTTKRWNVATAGTTVEIANYAETTRITISASTWFTTFIMNTARRTTGIAINAPIQVINGNCNPLTKFKFTRTSSGITITTVEDNTVIVAYRQTGLPDQSSGSSFTTTEYWG